MNKYFYDEDYFDPDDTYDPYDYPPRMTVDYMDYNYTFHFDGSAPFMEKEDD